MALSVKDAAGTTRSVKTTVSGSDHVPSHIVDQIPDAANVVEGAIADAAVTGDNPGTLSGKLRGLLKRWSLDIPVGVGQKAMAASLSVCLASDQGAVQNAAGNNIIGGIKQAGPFYTPVPIAVTVADASGTVDLTAAPGAAKVVIGDLIVSVDTNCEVSLIEETSLTYLGGWFQLANTVVSISNLKNGLRTLTNVKKMRIKTSVASKLRACGSWHEE